MLTGFVGFEKTEKLAEVPNGQVSAHESNH